MNRSVRLIIRTLLPAVSVGGVIGWAVAPAWTATAPPSPLGLSVVTAPQDVRTGDTVSARVTVSNGQDTPLHGVSVAAPDAPDCQRSNLTVPAHGQISYRCAMTAGEPGTYRAPVTATATSGGQRLSARAAMPYRVTRGYYPTPTPTPTPTHVPCPSPPGSTPRPPCITATPHLPTTGTTGPSRWLLAGALLSVGGALVLAGRRLRQRFYDRVLGNS